MIQREPSYWKSYHLIYAGLYKLSFGWQRGLLPFYYKSYQLVLSESQWLSKKSTLLVPIIGSERTIGGQQHSKQRFRAIIISLLQKRADCESKGPDRTPVEGSPTWLPSV